MITKNQTSKKYYAVYLLVLPVIAMLAMAFTTSSTNPEPPSMEQGTVTAAFKDAPEDFIPSIAPVDVRKCRISSGYGYRKTSDGKKSSLHEGMDFTLSEGEGVVSTANGTVAEAAHDSKRGNYVLIRHNDEFSTLYSHLKSYSVNKGDNVKKGQSIGIIGNTGHSTSVHLHYEVHKNGKAVNPVGYLPK
ncbi:MAG: M23 family metallopeptidase [Tannerella sp.]|jgi:murein DD-endopeptidase MepM/ murein hydrolase activator NlpD|nr:M23 family metallopeptidase [Tannerella sp.]